MENLYRYLLIKEKFFDLWDVDWCTKDEFVHYIEYMWKLNSGNLKEYVTFFDFLSLEYTLARVDPPSFYVPMRSLGFIKY